LTTLQVCVASIASAILIEDGFSKVAWLRIWVHLPIRLFIDALDYHFWKWKPCTVKCLSSGVDFIYIQLVRPVHSFLPYPFPSRLFGAVMNCTANLKLHCSFLFPRIIRLTEKPQGKRRLRRHRRRLEDNIKMCLKEIGLQDLDWIRVAQDMDHRRALGNTVMNLLVP
jgi:hypothetical protein